MTEADVNVIPTEDAQGAPAAELGVNREKDTSDHDATEVTPLAPTSIKAIVWEVIKPVATIGFVVSVVGAIALYVYLHRIGWPELLQPSLASKTGIAVVVISLLVVFISLMLTMYGSAYWTNLVAHSYERPSSMPRKLPVFAFGVHLVWLALLDITMLGFSADKSYAWAHSVKEHFNDWLAGFFVLVALASIWCHWWARRNAFDIFEPEIGFKGRLCARLRSLFPTRNTATGKWTWRVVSEDFAGRGRRVGQDAMRGSMLVLGSLFASTAACVFVEINPTIRSLDITFANSLIVCCATLPGVIVGIYYVARYRVSGSMKGSLKDVASFAVVMGIAACAIFPATTLLPLDTLSLGAASVFTDSEHQYALGKRDAWPLYEKIGFRLVDEKADKKSPIIFRAYERYRMGDILLLCTRSNTVVLGEEKRGSTSQPGSDPNPRKPAAASTVAVSGKVNDREGCIQTERGEVRRVEIAR
jgi:hypothetical protein